MPSSQSGWTCLRYSGAVCSSSGSPRRCPAPEPIGPIMGDIDGRAAEPPTAADTAPPGDGCPGIEAPGAPPSGPPAPGVAPGEPLPNGDAVPPGGIEPGETVVGTVPAGVVCAGSVEGSPSEPVLDWSDAASDEPPASA